MAKVPGGSATANRRSAVGFGQAAVTMAFVGVGMAFSHLDLLGLALGAAGLICGIMGRLLARPVRGTDFWCYWGTVLSFIVIWLNAVLLGCSKTDPPVLNWLMGR